MRTLVWITGRALLAAKRVPNHTSPSSKRLTLALKSPVAKGRSQTKQKS
jgi:hypothetical protein